MENQESNQEPTDTQSSDVNSTEGASVQSDVSTTDPTPTDTKPEAKEGDDKVVAIDGPDGKKYWPEEAALARINSLTAKFKQTEELLEELRTNPDVRKEYFGDTEDTGKTEVSAAQSQETNQAEDVDTMKPLNSWLGKLSGDPATQSFFNEFVGALLPTVEKSVIKYFKKELGAFEKSKIAPLGSIIGKRSIEDFSKANPLFVQKQKEVLALSKKKNMSFEDAFAVIERDELKKQLAEMKGGKSTANVAQNRDKMKSVPMAGRQTNNGKSAPQFNNWKEKLRATIEESDRELKARQ